MANVGDCRSRSTNTANRRRRNIPFALHALDPTILTKSATPDRRGMAQAEVMDCLHWSRAAPNGALPWSARPTAPILMKGSGRRAFASYEFTLFAPAEIGGYTYQRAQSWKLMEHPLSENIPRREAISRAICRRWSINWSARRTPTPRAPRYMAGCRRP